MSNDIPNLEDRRYFPAWQKAIRKHLTPSQWKTVTWPDGGPPSNRLDCLIWEKARAQAYNTIIQSIPDVILLGLGAHDELTSLRDFYHADHEGYTVSCVPGGCPRDLYNVICKWFNPTRAMIAAQMRCIANTDPAKIEDAELYVARMWLSKTCIDLCPTESNPVLLMLLCDAIKESHPAVVAALVAVDYTWSFSQVLCALSPEGFTWEPSLCPAERKRVADDTSREAKRVKTEPEEEASDVTVTSQTIEASR
ncbi:hypothetical protein CGCA056_v014264 [Colletotrichum aenigma]|uniref:uncharacterized protein n=1 Tax=Colletotrichum aenigma TaxID=1215731 RepID=UPI001872BF05|nr:uncharacterized protein CGCA056_v014264 [Colletotrichum aenigma]KAF5502422.1 hypothetical protein CGCA056_v014264 [Colletotrichum aenigma]